METIKIFIASSSELETDRKEFRDFLSIENDRFHKKDVYLELVEWEIFYNAVSQTSKQSDYNAELVNCQIVICLFYTKAGKYTLQEFDAALKQFNETGNPLIYTYFKEPENEVAPATDATNPDDAIAQDAKSALVNFKKRLGDLGHFYTVFKNIQDLKLQFRKQLDLLEDKGFIKVRDEVKAQTQDAVKNYFLKNAVIGSTLIAGGDIKIGDTIIINAPAKEQRPTNKMLCKNLLEAIQEYSPKAKIFLEQTIDESEKSNWETQDNYLTKAKSILISSYSSVLGDFLSKLIACNNQKDYFEITLAVFRRTLQLLNYAFISSLWDQNKAKEIQITADEQKLLKRMFTSGVELKISYYADLFKSLVMLFQAQNLKYPFPEIIKMENDLISADSFLMTCKSMDSYRQKYGEDQSMPPVEEIEKLLTSFLVSLNFLANYKMVSVKDIGYEALRNSNAQFLHAYTILGVNSAKNSFGRKYYYHDKPISTDAILLYSDKYIDGLNLYPFIIDINTLRNEQEVKLFFYTCCDDGEKTITYFDTFKISSDDGNDNDVVIEFTKEFEEIEKEINEIIKSAERDITELRADAAKAKTLKMYETYNVFRIAKEFFSAS